jgi:uncharacterized membrane protein YfcA
MEVGLLLVMAAAFGAGVVDSMVGGGGLIQLPVLLSVYPNVPPATVLGTSKVASIFGTTTAVARYARQVRIPWRMLLPFIVVTLLLSLGGAYTASLIPPDVFRPLVPVLLTLVLLYVLRRKDFGDRHLPHVIEGHRAAFAYGLIGAIGFYDGFFGPGTGSFLMVLFIRLFGFDFLHAAACSRLLNAAANVTALGYFATHGHVLWQVGLAIAVCTVAGAFTGTHLAIRHGSGFVRKVFVVVVSALILKTLWDALRAYGAG